MIEGTFEEAVLQLIILMVMVSHFFNFLHRHLERSLAATILLHLFLNLFDVSCRISSEAADFNFTGTHSSHWINYDCYKWTLSLVHSLRTNIDTREPAPITWMRVIPSDNVFGSVDSLAIFLMIYHIFISVCRSIYSGLSCLDRHRK